MNSLRIRRIILRLIAFRAELVLFTLCDSSLALTKSDIRFSIYYASGRHQSPPLEKSVRTELKIFVSSHDSVQSRCTPTPMGLTTWDLFTVALLRPERHYALIREVKLRRN